MKGRNQEKEITMKRNNRQHTALLAGTLLVACALSIPAFAQTGQGHGPGGSQGDGLSLYLATLPIEQLSATEVDGLLFTYEEEKMARDVYTTLGATWNVRIFGNIAKAEQSHMDAVKLMIDRYEIVDPAADLLAGTFLNTALQKLYADLVAKGSYSIADALEAGATIEDLDLRDETALIASSDNQDLDTVYQNLAKGSRNHLRSFVDQLALLSISYVPLYLDQATFDAIVSSEMERGVYDAAGVPVFIGAGSGACDGTGQAAGNGGGNGSSGSNGSGTGTGTGTCDGSGPNGSSNGGQGGGRP